MFVLKRSQNNPILIPDENDSFDSLASFNGCPIKEGNNIHILYRAMNKPTQIGPYQFSMSTIGIATSKNGGKFGNRKLFLEPEQAWERYGCEDARVTKIGSKYYIFYTALSTFPFSADGIKVGVAISDDLKKIKERHLVTPFNAKAMVLFPEKINGKYVAILTVNTDRPPSQTAIAIFDKIEQIWSEEYWIDWYKNLKSHLLKIEFNEGDHIEVGSVPIKVEGGWLLMYSYIQKYNTNDKIFGVEAVLLDEKDPHKIIGSTKTPLLIPEESFEIYGQVPRIVFPTGGILEGDELTIYYGGADTVCATAVVSLKDLLDTIKNENAAERFSGNPILLTKPENAWEARAVFNPATLDLNGKIHILYRAMSMDNTSVMGYASTKDGFKIDERLDVPAYKPRTNDEAKLIPNGNSGCEDPRLTFMDDKVYMSYTAYNGVRPPSVAITSIGLHDFLDKRWKWSEPKLVTKDGVDDKDGCLLPEKINGKYCLFHRVNNMICIDYSDTIDFDNRNSFKNIEVLRPRKGMWDGDKVGISATPIKTKKGWLLIYHGVSDRKYRVGLALLDLNNPAHVISRSTDYILSPEMDYEKSGQISNVVFPCGAVVRGDTIFIYYGGGDSNVCVATISMKKVMKSLLIHQRTNSILSKLL